MRLGGIGNGYQGMSLGGGSKGLPDMDLAGGDDRGDGAGRRQGMIPFWETMENTNLTSLKNHACSASVTSNRLLPAF
jgi:hypothetical protein